METEKINIKSLFPSDIRESNQKCLKHKKFPDGVVILESYQGNLTRRLPCGECELEKAKFTSYDVQSKVMSNWNMGGNDKIVHTDATFEV